jgi:hypothetical protein
MLKEKTGGVAQVVQYLSSKDEALNSKPSTAKFLKKDCFYLCFLPL